MQQHASSQPRMRLGGWKESNLVRCGRVFFGWTRESCEKKRQGFKGLRNGDVIKASGGRMHIGGASLGGTRPYQMGLMQSTTFEQIT
jgi:hypothetical protein